MMILITAMLEFLLLRALTLLSWMYSFHSWSSSFDDDENAKTDDDERKRHHRVIPKHIAFVMDGNRRWEKEQQLKRLEKGINKGEDKDVIENESKSSKEKGHERGAKTLQNVLRWSLKLPQIETISVYAFSLENFNRDEREVDGLMSLCIEELPKLARSDAVRNANARIVISGRLDALSEEVRQACVYAMEETRRTSWRDEKEETGGRRGGEKEKTVVLNICLAYSGAEEFGSAAWAATEEEDEEEEEDEVGRRSGEESIKRRFYYGGNGSENRYDRGNSSRCSEGGGKNGSNSNSSSKSNGRIDGVDGGKTRRRRSKKNEKNKLEAVILPDVDLVVRTSGTNRLSDFMTTRLENALIVFVDALWPDFGVFDFFSVIWRYRKASSILRDNKKKREMKKEDQIFYDN
ncbi:undecaprenyl diphosphate synthase [Bathycoccus prasinos]|uniref:Undecaprenyl diphosphate synthase n=1 Tax=Bathycoccus prasinos TaxID=41875 RepID=K8EQL9_9CHLO|nr:undecaprenyl diphosphate synthase [Bathycoccus prasinos]CCO20336.1 undecaprenyl diphosphate synthase [Bathycoccus prasinos]|eukprot:XP_007508719.1 undecaprenyl diphosphate synthase [Bathycoccus prasinos]